MNFWRSFLSCHHDDVIKWKHFPRNWPFVREIHRSPVNFPHKGQWRGALMFSLIYAWINDWVNNREAGDLRRQHGHYDVIVMYSIETVSTSSMIWYNTQNDYCEWTMIWYMWYDVIWYDMIYVCYAMIRHDTIFSLIYCIWIGQVRMGYRIGLKGCLVYLNRCIFSFKTLWIRYSEIMR